MGFARVQNASNGANGASVTVTLGTAPTNGNLLVAWGNSDATITIGGSGWTAGPSVIDGNGAYFWWKVAGASEPSSVTFTPSVSDYICAGLLEYSGNTASPLDVTGSSTISNSFGSSTTAVSVTTTAAHDLGIAVAALHTSISGGPQAAPTSPVWTGSFSNLQSQGAVDPATDIVYSFVADNLDLGAAGAVATGVSWSGTTWPDRQELLMTFKAAAAPPPPPAVPSAVVLRRRAPRAAAPRGRAVRVAAGPSNPAATIIESSGTWNFAARIWIAFDPLTATNPNWIDISGFVETDKPISITRGRPDGMADVNATRVTLTVDNSDGRFSAANPNGAWYGRIHKGNWLKVEVFPPSGVVSSRFVGFITSLPTAWSGFYATSVITASDRFEKLSQAPAHQTMIEHEVLSDPNLAGNIKGYWNLHEDANARSFGDTSGAGARALVAASFGGLPVGTGFGANAVAGPGFDGQRAVSFNPPSLNQGTYLTAPIASPTGSWNTSTGVYTGLYPTLELWFQMPISVGPTNYQILGCFYDPAANFACNVMVQNHKIVFTQVGVGFANAATYGTDFYPYPQRVDDGAWHHVIVGCAATNGGGGWVSMVVIVDGVWARVSTQNGGSVGTTGGNFTRLLVGAGYYSITATEIIYFGQSNLAEVAWYWSDLLNASTTAGRPPDHLSHYNAGATGFAGESTDRRTARIARYAGIPQTYALSQDTFNAGPPLGPGSSSPATLGQVQSYSPVKTAWVNLSPGGHSVGTQSIVGRKTPDVMREAARTEGSPLFVDRSGYLALQPSTIRQNTSPAWTVAALDLDPQTAMPDDYAYTVNQMTVTPNGQAAQTVIGAVGRASQAKHGVYDKSQATASLNPVEAQSLGLQLIQVNADPAPRLAPLVLEAATLATQSGYGAAWYDAVLATEISTPIRVTGLPSQAGGGNYDVLIEGWTETITAGNHVFSFTTSPVQGPTYQLDDVVLGHLDTDGSTLATILLNTTALTFAVATTGAGTGSPLWTTSGADFPFDINIDGEQITISSITGASSPQTFNASARSVNGVVASHSVGAAVSLWQPLTLAY